uniref:Uncharacterized protein n=1 Tax=Solanum tuberosum TaxID=4113 RepID=M1CEU4_SOLTU
MSAYIGCIQPNFQVSRLVYLLSSHFTIQLMRLTRRIFGFDPTKEMKGEVKESIGLIPYHMQRKGKELTFTLRCH